MTQPELPPDLIRRLVAAGAQDEASLQAALAADEQLRADYQAWLIRSTLHAFAATPDAEALAELVERAPILLEPAMFEAIERAVQQAVAVGDNASAEALIQRAEALKVIKARGQAQTPLLLVQALIAFVQAPDDDAARALFVEHKDLLIDVTAENLLWQRFQAEDETSKRHLEARQGLLHLLRLAEGG